MLKKSCKVECCALAPSDPSLLSMASTIKYRKSNYYFLVDLKTLNIHVYVEQLNNSISKKYYTYFIQFRKWILSGKMVLIISIELVSASCVIDYMLRRNI